VLVTIFELVRGQTDTRNSLIVYQGNERKRDGAYHATLTKSFNYLCTTAPPLHYIKICSYSQN